MMSILDDERASTPEQVAGDRAKARRPDLAYLVTKDLLQQSRRADNAPFSAAEAQAASKSASDAIFSQLQLIQSLQNEIANEHSALENLTVQPGSPISDHGGDPASAGSSKSAASPASPSRAGNTKDRTSKKRTDTQRTHAEPANAHDRNAAHAYDKLAAGFHERQKGVDAIMAKMTRLSQAVKDFHSLPPPTLFPDSRMLETGAVMDSPTTMSPKRASR